MSASEFLRAGAVLLFAAIAGAQPGGAQGGVPSQFDQGPSTAVETVLRQMMQTAGVIFAGEVVAVRRLHGSSQNSAEGVITVEFRVDQALRGCTSGHDYTLREWAGLWTSGDRYRVGQRLLVFLHSPDRDGLSSPVGGKAGVVPLRGGGQAPGPYDSGETASEWLADLRWVQARAMRDGSPEAGSETTPPRPGRPIGGRLHDAAIERGDLMPDPFLPDRFARWMPLPPSTEPATQSLSQLLSLCREWMRASDGAL